jgi:hypothetical protein
MCPVCCISDQNCRIGVVSLIMSPFLSIKQAQKYQYFIVYEVLEEPKSGDAFSVIVFVILYKDI